MLSKFSELTCVRFKSLRALLCVVTYFFVKKPKRSHDLRGYNCAFWRADFIAVNGYSNDVNGWGHEDIELVARFINFGLLQKSIKLTAVCYHLDHKINGRNKEQDSYNLYLEVVAQRKIVCENGLSLKSIP